jgi:hypothetical protein
MGAAWAPQAMCESAFTVKIVGFFFCFTTNRSGYPDIIFRYTDRGFSLHFLQL